MGVKALLHLFEARDALREDRARLLDIGRKAEGFRRIESLNLPGLSIRQCLTILASFIANACVLS